MQNSLYVILISRYFPIIENDDEYIEFSSNKNSALPLTMRYFATKQVTTYSSFGLVSHLFRHSSFIFSFSSGLRCIHLP